MSEAYLLEVENLSQSFGTRKRSMLGGRTVQALRDVSLRIRAGQSFGLVGESGCGKSTLAKTVLNVHPPANGIIRFDGQDLSKLGRRGWHALRREIQYVFQDPLAALDPRRTILSQVTEALTIHGLGKRSERAATAKSILNKVGLPPESHARYPHQISGGQRQRVVLARALALKPKLLICDEPVSALDVSIQAQIINLLCTLWRDEGLTMLFISHDLAVVQYLCDPVAVMYLGRICELAPTEALFSKPAHPYTKQLIDAIPVPDPEQRHASFGAQSDPPDPSAPPPGCAFCARCPRAREICQQEEPPLRPLSSARHVACHFPLTGDA